MWKRTPSSDSSLHSLPALSACIKYCLASVMDSDKVCDSSIHVVGPLLSMDSMMRAVMDASDDVNACTTSTPV